MRSRYSAYALGLVDYLIDTTHRENVQLNPHRAAWRRQLIDYCQATVFERLDILSTHEDEIQPENEGRVTFEARLRSKATGEAFVLRETSRFVKPGKRWLYHSAVMSD